MSSNTNHYDCLIIGSGQSGTPLAGAFAKAGKRTALVESTHIGGCCINDGCTPTKTLIASGRVAYLAGRGADYGVQIGGGVSIDMEKVRQRKRDIVTSFRGGNESRTQDAGVDVINGEASFQDKSTLSVKLKGGGTKTVTAETIFINTGERPVLPELKGLDQVPKDRVLDSTSVQELGEVPQHLIIMGGGYIGLEFGQLFRRLGAEVTIIQRGSQLLPREDADVAKCMLDILREDGITVHLNTSVKSVTTTTKSSSTISVSTNSEHNISGSHLLFAAGRRPNSDMLNLSTAGIKTNSKGYIIVNDSLETNVSNIYAMGDVKGPPAFTHISYDDFRIIRSKLIDRASSSSTSLPSTRIVPYVVYTDPQLGHVGMHEREAREQGLKIKVAKMPMKYVARALETDESRGMMKAVVEAETGKILGFTCLGLEGGEIMSVVQMAMIGGVRWEVLRDGIWAHPTLAESLNNLWGYLE